MTFERFSKCVDALDAFYKREEKLADALEPFNSSFTAIDFCPEITQLVYDIIKEDFNDKYDNFSYWFFDQDQGKKVDCYFITENDGSIIKNRTKEDIYKYLVKCKEESN